MVKKENTSKDNDSGKRTHRSSEDLGIDKSNKAFTNLEKQMANLNKAKRNIIMSGNKELAKKFNFALNKFSETLNHIEIIESDFDITPTEKAKKESFSVMDMEITETETES